MYGSYSEYVDDEYFDNHGYDDNTDYDIEDDTDHDTDEDTDDDADDDTNDDTDDVTDDGGGNLYPIKAQGSRTLSRHE